jgi:hypothetical protein
MRRRELADNLAVAPAIDECICRQGPLRFAARRPLGRFRTSKQTG